jgi:hypothetical protein
MPFLKIQEYSIDRLGLRALEAVYSSSIGGASSKSADPQGQSIHLPRRSEHYPADCCRGDFGPPLRRGILALSRVPFSFD